MQAAAKSCFVTTLELFDGINILIVINYLIAVM